MAEDFRDGRAGRLVRLFVLGYRFGRGMGMMNSVTKELYTSLVKMDRVEEDLRRALEEVRAVRMVLKRAVALSEGQGAHIQTRLLLTNRWPIL